MPFGESETLDEPLLATPLVVRWPQASALAGRRVGAPSTPIDLARTALDALGLAPPSAFRGLDLASLAQGAVNEQRPLAATRASRFSVRWGPYVLMGVHDRETRVCDLSLDPGVHRRRESDVAARPRTHPALRGRRPRSQDAARARAHARDDRRAHDGGACALGSSRGRPRERRRALTGPGVCSRRARERRQVHVGLASDALALRRGRCSVGMRGRGAKGPGTAQVMHGGTVGTGALWPNRPLAPGALALSWCRRGD